jgi:superfamily II DNA or RNA helicase
VITIVIGNSVCKVVGINRKQFSDLRERTMYVERTGRWIMQIAKDKRTGKTLIDPRTRKPMKKRVPEILKHFLMDKRGQFPTGLLYIVEDYLAQAKVVVRYQDERVQPRINQEIWDHVETVRKFQPYLEQTAAAAAALEYGRGIIVGPTGVGKSTIAAEIIDAFRVRTLLVVPSLELKRQLTEGLREYFGQSSVGPLVKGKPAHLVTVENVDALDPDKVIEGIDLVLIDEFHHSGAATYRQLNKTAWSKVYFKIGLTATPFRSRDAERLLLESVLSHVIYRIEYQTAVDKGYIVPMEAYYVELPEIKMKGPAKDWQSVYKELVVERPDRNKIIADMACNLEREGISALVLVKQVNHGKLISEFVEAEGVQIPFVKGENDDNREVIQAFNKRKYNVMIGTNGILGEGVDTKPCEYVIVGGLGKSKNAFMQQVGRGFRRFGDKVSCKIVLFYDPTHEWTMEHFRSQCQYLLDEYGITPTKLF